MPPLPSPDPSASLSAYQAYAVGRDAWFADLGQLAFVAGVTALAALLFLAGVIAVTTVLHRG
jgi:hypothetical protein